MPSLTIDRLRAVMSYDPHSGELRWLVASKGTKAGAIAGFRQSGGYVSVCVDQERFLAHRLVWFYVHGIWPREQIDHIDRNRKNNAIANLREATPQQNQWNRWSSKATKGTHFFKRTGKWTAQIVANGRSTHLGYFYSEAAAAAAYNAAAAELHGEFARLNP